MLRAVTLAPGSIEVISEPQPADDLALVRIRVELVGVCGSDVHLFRGTHPYGRYPQTQGHEFVGIIERIPSVGAAHLTVGQRVVVEPFVACGNCHACAIGKSNCCLNLKVMGAHVPGALAQSVQVEVAQVYPTSLEAQLAVLVEPVSIGFQAVRRARIAEGQNVLVIGAGLVGLGAALAAIATGARVAVSDSIAARLNAAVALGAVATVDATSARSRVEIEAFAPDGPDVVIEATGSPAVLAQAVDVVAAGGTVVAVGISELSVTLPMIDITRKELTILGSRNNLGLFGEAERLVKSNADTLRLAVRTKTFPLAEAAEAVVFADIRRSDVEKVIIAVTKENE